MRRAPVLSYLLWSSVGAGAMVGCGDGEQTFIDAAVDAASADAATDAADLDGPDVDAPIDAPIDAIEIDAIGPMVMVPASATMTSECGQALPPTVTIAVTNQGDQALVVSAASATGGFVVTTSLPLTVPAGGSMSLTIRPPAAVIGTDLGGSQRTGTLTLTTNAAGPSPTVDLTADIVGANLELVDFLGQPLTSVSLMSSAGCPSPVAIYVRNTGNSTASLASGSASYFAFSGWSPGPTVSPGSATVSNQLRPWSLIDNGCSHNEVLDFDATGAVCTTQPMQLTAAYAVFGQSTCFCS